MHIIFWDLPISSKKVAGLSLKNRALRAATKTEPPLQAVSVQDLKQITTTSAFLLIRTDTVFEVPVLEELRELSKHNPQNCLQMTCGDATGLYAMPADFASVLMREGSFEKVLLFYETQGRLLRRETKAGNFWTADTPKRIKKAQSSLYKSLYRRLRESGENKVLSYINRPLSSLITRWVVKTPLTPNQVSISVALLSVLTLYFFYKADPFSIAVGGIIFQLRSILDCCDGEVAKLKLAWSKRGQWIDTISDNVGYGLFFIGAIIGSYRSGFAYTVAVSSALIFGLIAMLSLMFSYLTRFTDSGSLITIEKKLSSGGALRAQHPIFDWLLKFKFLMKKDYFSIIFMALCLMGKLHWILILAAVGTNLGWMILVLAKREFSAGHEEDPAIGSLN